MSALPVTLATVVIVVVASALVLIARSRRRPAMRGFGPFCPDCGAPMDLEDKSTFSGRDMRTYRCAGCGREEIVDNGPALWQVLSEANAEAAETEQK